MIVIKEDNSRPYSIGQINISLVDFEPTLDMPIRGKYGYWCDLSHVKIGILRPLIFKFTREVREILAEIDGITITIK